MTLHCDKDGAAFHQYLQVLKFKELVIKGCLLNHSKDNETFTKARLYALDKSNFGAVQGVFSQVTLLHSIRTKLGITLFI